MGDLMIDIFEILKTLKEKYPRLELRKGHTILNDEEGMYHKEFDVLSGAGLDFAILGNKPPYRVCSKNISGITSRNAILKDVAKKISEDGEVYFDEFSSEYIPNICESNYAGFISLTNSVDNVENGIASVIRYAKNIEKIYESEIDRLLNIKWLNDKKL